MQTVDALIQMCGLPRLEGGEAAYVLAVGAWLRYVVTRVGGNRPDPCRASSTRPTHGISGRSQGIHGPSVRCVA